jgi:hypothetical protein
MGFGLSFGGGSSKTKSSSVNEIDAELKPLRTKVLGQSMGLANQPIQQFQGQRVAGFTPYQQQAFSQVGALGQQGHGLAQRGFNILGGIGSAADRMPAYQNQFTNEVIDRSLSDLERQRQITGTADAAKAVSAKAFGGSRQAVQNALTNEAYARQAGDMSANLRYQGFNTALGAAQQDVQQQQALAQALQGAGYGAIDAMGQAGGMQQQLTQAELDAEREKFYEPRNLQMQNLDFLTGVLAGVPQGGTSSGTSKTNTKSFGFNGSIG